MSGFSYKNNLRFTSVVKVMYWASFWLAGSGLSQNGAEGRPGGGGPPASVQNRIGKAAQQLENVAAKFRRPQKRSFQVKRYVELPDFVDHLVMIDAGRKQGLVKGSVLKAMRLVIPLQANPYQLNWVASGVVKVVILEDTYAIAKITDQESLQSKIFFPEHPGVMAGDWLVENPVKLTRITQINPTKIMRFDELFVDPKAYPSTFQLSPRGMKILAEHAQKIAARRMPLLMIEGHTDTNGRFEENQVESYQRAMTIRQYLITQLGFDPARLVAIGYGESDPVDQSYVPGYRRKNRRIVLKVKSLTAKRQ